MTTQNIEITNHIWENLATVGSIVFEENQSYSITVRGVGSCEVAIATSKPDEAFLGHIVKADENFNFTYKGEDVWIKCGNSAIVVIS